MLRRTTLTTIKCPLSLQLVDTGKLAPFDFLTADDLLSEDEVARARAAQLMWTSESLYSILPWSAIILESAPMETLSGMLKASGGT